MGTLITRHRFPILVCFQAENPTGYVTVLHDRVRVCVDQYGNERGSVTSFVRVQKRGMASGAFVDIGVPGRRVMINPLLVG